MCACMFVCKEIFPVVVSEQGAWGFKVLVGKVTTYLKLTFYFSVMPDL